MSTGGAGDGPGRGGQVGAAALVVSPRAGRGSGPRCPGRWAPWPRVPTRAAPPVGSLAEGSGPQLAALGVPSSGLRAAHVRCFRVAAVALGLPPFCDGMVTKAFPLELEKVALHKWLVKSIWP